MPDERFYLVKTEVLPEVFHRVMKAKQLLSSGRAASVSAAARAVGLSRSAFYKYKDCIFEAQREGPVTLNAVLRDEKGALQTLLAGFSEAGASVLTIHQKSPHDGVAEVSVTISTEGMGRHLDETIALLKGRSAVIDLQIGTAENTSV
ncbi:MAG: amino acid-binding protein [Oscillospiraceae bacterium]|nr:amino acid-binding protein [Oscillospiraceae bacterium]